MNTAQREFILGDIYHEASICTFAATFINRSVFGSMLKKLAYFLLPFNILIDTLLLFSEQLSWLPFVRAGLLLALLIFVFFNYGKHVQNYSMMLLFVVYCLLQLFFVTDFNTSFNITLKVCLPIACFALGYCLFNSVGELRKLSISIIWVYLILIANFVLSQVFNLGQSVYSEDSDFRVGNLDDAWNIFTYSVLLAPMILFFAGETIVRRWSTYVGAGLNALLVVISIKRIAILGLVTGTAIRWAYGTPVKRILKSLVLLSVAVALAFPFFRETIEKRLSARSDRFESGAIEREGRFLESEYVWEGALSFDEPMRSLFGLEGFNSVGNYADGRFGDRQLHVDFNLIVNTIGLVGLMLYFAMFVQFGRRMIQLQSRTTLSPQVSLFLRSVFWMLLLNQFITSFAGQMYHVSYRLIVFVMLGAILGTFKNSSHARANRLQWK